jgi:uncharacterized protein (TIGR00251 family)
MSGTPAYHWRNHSLLLSVYIQPNAPKDGYAGIFNDCIKLRIKAPPVDGKANRELLRFIGRTFAVPQGSGRKLPLQENRNPQPGRIAGMDQCAGKESLAKTRRREVTAQSQKPGHVSEHRKAAPNCLAEFILT